MMEEMVDELDNAYDEIIIRLKKLPVNADYDLGMFVMRSLNRTEHIINLLDKGIAILDELSDE
jgi:hypothetical protein